MAGAAHGVQQGLAARARPRPQPGVGQPQAPGTSLGRRTGQGQAGTWAHMWAQLARAHDQTGQGCGELEAGSAVASLGMKRKLTQ